MPHKKYLVTLAPDERDRLTRLLTAGKASARTLTSCGLVPEVRSVHRFFVNLLYQLPSRSRRRPRPGCFVSSGSCDPE